jgi:simple sugar transport system permease protein
MDATALLITAALGVLVAFRAGAFNLGGEGQIYAGGLAAAAVLLNFGFLGGAAALAVAAVAGMAAGAVLSGTAGYLKSRFGVDELISSFLLSSAVSPVADYLVSGPLRDPANSLLATARFPQDRLLPAMLPPSTLNLSLPISLLLLAAAAYVLNRTALGFRIRVAGSSPDFARYAGIEPAAYWTPAMGISGLSTGWRVSSPSLAPRALPPRFPRRSRWGAIAVALIARNAPAALVPAAAAYAWLESGSETAMLSSELSFETAAFVQAAVFLLVTAKFSGRKFGRAFDGIRTLLWRRR